MILKIIRGLPGSGKSTFAKESGCFHVENDMMKISDGCYRPHSRMDEAKADVRFLVEYALKQGFDVAVSNVFFNIKSMEPYLELGKKYGASIKVYHMTADYGNIHGVPSHAVANFKANWEPFEGEIKIGDERKK